MSESEITTAKTLDVALPDEMERVRKIRDIYLQTPNGHIAAAMMAASLDKAARAAAAQDTVAMVRAYYELTEYQI